jgi:hypothetical protein
VPTGIGSLNEKSLHVDLKHWYAQPTDRLEVLVDGFIIDIVRDEMLIEIQTRNFSALKRKLMTLTKQHPVRLVYPIAAEKWLVKLDDDGQPASRRKSPKRGTVENLFAELVSFPRLIIRPNFSLLALLIQEEETRRYDGRRGWRRRGWVTDERRLLAVVSQHLFETPVDLQALIPAALTDPFTTADLAQSLGKPRRLAQQMAYCLREMEAISQVGKSGRAILYTRTDK